LPPEKPLKLADYGYPVPLRNLPFVGPLEWAVAQQGWTDELEEAAHELAEEMFGICDDDTHLCIEAADSAWLGGREVPAQNAEELFRLQAEWERHFEPLRYFRDESDAYWTSKGWDVTDGEGKQLEVMRYIGRSMICFVEGLHEEALKTIGGFEDDDGAEAWGARLEEEAKRFKPRS
jgi:hypothetical protein